MGLLRYQILLGGISDPGTLDDVSQLCGSVAIGDDDNATVRVVPPELVRSLPDWRALVLRMNLSPVIVKIRPAWKRHGGRGGRRAVMIPQPVIPPLSALAAVPAPELAAEPLPDAFPLPGLPERAPWLTKTGTDGR